MKKLSLIVCAMFASLTMAQAPPNTKPALTEEQKQAILSLLGQPSTSEIELEVTNESTTQGGSVQREAQAQGTGAGFTTTGDKIVENITGTAPTTSLPGFGAGATGGASEKETKAEVFKPPASVWKNPLFWLGLLCLAGAGACVHFGLRRPGIGLGVAGISLIATAFFPWLLLIGVAVAVAAIAFPHLRAEFVAKARELDVKKYKEPLRAVLAGEAEIKASDPAAYDRLKKATEKHAEKGDSDVIDEIKREDKLGKYA